MEYHQSGDQAFAHKLSSLTISHTRSRNDASTNMPMNINDLPLEILRLILRYANTCNAPNYVTLAEVIQAISRIQPQECIFNIPGLPFSVCNQTPPLLALIWARQVCRLWRIISDDIIYENVGSNTWFTPDIGDQFLDFLRLHLEQREAAVHCYARTHTIARTDVLDLCVREVPVVLHLIVVHHREDRQTSFRVFRQKPGSYTASPSISQEQHVWAGCDCTRPHTAGVPIGTPFVHVLASDNELEKVVQLVWRMSFQIGSNQLIAGLQHIAMARRLLDA